MSDGIWDGESPWVTLVRQEYEAAGLDRWNNDRVNRTCRLLHTDIYTLCAVCGLFDRSRVRHWLKRDNWPMEMTLQFYHLERAKCRVPGPSMMHNAMAAAFNMKAPCP